MISRNDFFNGPHNQQVRPLEKSLAVADIITTNQNSSSAAGIVAGDNTNNGVKYLGDSFW
jgi:hypothetical protein